MTLSTVCQDIHSSLSTAPITAFAATLKRTQAFSEDRSKLSRVVATLTRHLHLNPFVCHSYKKHGGWRRAIVNFFVAQTSVCAPLGHFIPATSEAQQPQEFKNLAVLPVTSHQSPATSCVHPLPRVTSHESPGTDH